MAVVRWGRATTSEKVVAVLALLLGLASVIAGLTGVGGPGLTAALLGLTILVLGFLQLRQLQRFVDR